MMSVPLVSVVIVNWNKVDYLRSCIDSLRKSTHESLEIIVVDNGSTDGSVEYLEGLTLLDHSHVPDSYLKELTEFSDVV